MAESRDAAWLRSNWGTERLSESEGRWIAVLNSEVVATGDTPEEVVSRARQRISDAAPLFAFVVLGALQP